MNTFEKSARRHQMLVYTRPHIVLGWMRARIFLFMWEGCWNVGIAGNVPGDSQDMQQLMQHIFVQTAMHWVDAQNAELARKRTLDVIGAAKNATR